MKLIDAIEKVWEANKSWLAGAIFLTLVFLWVFVFFGPRFFQRLVRWVLVLLLLASLRYAYDISDFLFGYVPQEQFNEYLIRNGVNGTTEHQEIAESNLVRGAWSIFQLLVVLVIGGVEVYILKKGQS